MNYKLSWCFVYTDYAMYSKPSYRYDVIVKGMLSIINYCCTYNY